ncbi:amidase [Neoroseomonas lacus]|uniref:Glutamyl-tRNA(Gln) amidotransferase subunit A n=1 Tax=Neoroseomonas lacus TaxID=287609 RepID=A0A917NVB2_9PROT|nr:amidase [Neoroseomonas lacus]GGJ33368.1 glutamyl-tRNA(Gln) amidotransferase subunit A [Neoroseomonas lacus]
MIPTIAEAAKQIAAKQLSPVEFMKDRLAKAEALNPEIHAFIRFTPEIALAQAQAAEARQMAGTLKGPLDGIPIGHKDIYETAGVPTTGHSRVLIDHVPAADAAAVTAWAEAGAVMLGKLATHEFAWGGPSFDLPWPPARNPWDTARFTAGSSSGTGAAVAAGVILGGTGSDTGGSIRGPASLCGTAGIKPTYGLCSRRGVLPLSHSLDTVGPLAWTVEDCAIMLDALTGYDPTDASSANRPKPDLLSRLNGGVKGLRIGVIRHFHEVDCPVSPGMAAGIASVVKTLEGLGAIVEEVTLPSLHDFNAAGWMILAADAFVVHEPWLRTKFRDYGEFLRERLALAATISSADYLQAQRRRRELCDAMGRVMERCDLVLTAAAPGEARLITEMGKWASFQSPNFTIPFNLTGQPALTVCAGVGEGGLPVGVQLVGRPFEDATVLRAGHAYEQATSWRATRPAMAA